VNATRESVPLFVAVASFALVDEHAPARSTTNGPTTKDEKGAAIRTLVIGRLIVLAPRKCNVPSYQSAAV
jgi:hypothetical protein